MADDLDIKTTLKALVLKQFATDQTEEDLFKSVTVDINRQGLIKGDEAITKSGDNYARRRQALIDGGHAPDSTLVRAVDAQYESFVKNMDRLQERTAG